MGSSRDRIASLATAQGLIRQASVRQYGGLGPEFFLPRLSRICLCPVATAAPSLVPNTNLSRHFELVGNKNLDTYI